MLERSEVALKALCGVLAALLLYRLGLAVLHINPLYHVTIPALPTLFSNTATPSGTNTSAVSPPAKAVTNQSLTTKGTNVVSPGTNLVAHSTNVVGGSNKVIGLNTNMAARVTNAVVQGTNSTAVTTNLLSQATNSPATNASAKLAGPVPPNLERRRGGGMPGMPPGMQKPGPELPPDVQARIDRVVESEILAPVMRPLPMALLGIAGRDVFLRAPNGQTGLIKEGDELGGVKLLRVGVNRVLIEENGEQKELTIFAGLGSESLLSTPKEKLK